MSLWADYYRERLGHSTIEHDWGVLSYAIQGEACEVYDIFIVPEERKSGKGRRLLDEVAFRAQQAGAKRLIGFNWPGVRGSEASLQAAFAYGFRMLSCEGGRIILVKELGAEDGK